MIWGKVNIFINKPNHRSNIKSSYLCATDDYAYDDFFKEHGYAAPTYNYKVIYDCTRCKYYYLCGDNLGKHQLCDIKKEECTNNWYRERVADAKDELGIYHKHCISINNMFC